ncbi:MAG: tetratricopeptide repeat protein, partial [Candidatus Binatia bacterium]
VVLHAAASAAVLDLALLLVGATDVALVVALLFAVHPVHTEAVANIAGRPELLAALFGLVALSAFLRARREGATPGWDVVACGALAAGLFSKESAFTVLPLLALLYAWTRPGRPRWHALVPYAAVGFAYVAVRRVVIGSLVLAAPPPLLDNPLAHLSTLDRLRTAAVVLRDYVAVLALPIRLSADDGFNQVPAVTSWGDARFLVSIALLAAVAGAVWLAGRRRAGIVVVGAAFGVLALSLTANVLFPIGTNRAERLLYLPSFGWCLALGWLGATWARGSRGRIGVVAVVLLLLAGRAWARNEDWRSNQAFFAATVAASPNGAKANKNAGSIYAMTGDWEAAQYHYERALEIDPWYALAALGLGGVRAARGAVGEARTWYARAATLDPTLVAAHVNLGELLLRAGDSAGAEAAFRAGVKGAGPQAQLILGVLAARAAGGDADAERLSQELRALPPGSPEMAAALATVRTRFQLP